MFNEPPSWRIAIFCVAVFALLVGAPIYYGILGYPLRLWVP